MKQLIISLTDEEWTEVVSSVRHELGEPLDEKRVEDMVIREATKFIRETYLRDLGA